jgi:hypothetical protein
MSEDSEDAPRQAFSRFLADAAPELIGAGIGGSLQLGGGDPLSGALVGSAIALAMRFDAANWQQSIGRAAYTTQLAADAVGGEQELERLATTDEHRLELTARVLRAAARTPLADKLPALARVLADGLDDDAKVDEAFVLAAALDDLEAPHVQVLALFDSAPSEHGDRGITAWEPDQIVSALPTHGQVHGRGG